MFFVLSKLVWLFAVPSNLLALVALGGALTALVRPGRRLGAGIAAAALAILLLIGFGPLPAALLLPLEDRFPIFRDDGRPVAGIIVLGGASDPTVGRARGQLALNEAGERLVAMADLARRYPAARIVFTGGSANVVAEEPPEADVIRDLQGELGLPAGRVTYEDRSRTTWENAVETRRIVEPRPGERWLLVTSARHMPRAVGCFRAVGLDVMAYPVDFATAGPGDLSGGGVTLPYGLRRFDDAAKEWAGLLAYRLSGRTSSLFPAPASAPASSGAASLIR